MRELVIYSAVGVWGIVLIALSIVTIRYHITEHFLRITWLGIPVRWLRLKNIKQITVQRVWWAERYWNALRPGNRYLCIHKHSGLIKHLIITPKNHMVFKADLERARHRLQGLPASDVLNPPVAAPSHPSASQAAAN